MVSSLNLPNLISLSRVFLAPVVMVFLTVYRQDTAMGFFLGDLIAGGVFIIASLTDAADGYIARKQGVVTNLGKFIDPLADKILVVAVLVSLVELQRLPAWMVVLIISREFIVTGIRMVAASNGVVIAASNSGKIKTVAQIVAICLVIFNIPVIAMPAMWLATFLTVSSGMDYLIKAKGLL